MGSATQTYDDNGNLTSDGVKSYTWNARDQLTAISGGGITASFSYDALGKRISKTINSTTTDYLYDGANVVQEQAGGTATANLLTGGVDRFFSRTDGSGTVTPLVDALGSVVALTDSSGTVQTTYSYEPFGKTSSSGTASTNAQKYTGREDDGTGLYYYRARYYSPDAQRFISEDPIELAGGDINLYGYVGNNPINFVDPFGLDKDYSPWWDPFDWFAGPAACEWLGKIGSACAGFGDNISYGMTDSARNWTGANDAVDTNSGWYEGGDYAGYAWQAAMAGAGAAHKAGYKVAFNHYSNAKGGGINILKNGERKFAIDWHRFKLKSTGQMVNRPHVHWGATKSQMKKHRSPFTGKPM